MLISFLPPPIPRRRRRDDPASLLHEAWIWLAWHRGNWGERCLFVLMILLWPAYVLLAAIAINYTHRQMIGILKDPLSAEMGWDEKGYADVVFWFQAAYALGYLAWGWLTMGQVQSIPLIVLGLVLIVMSRRAPVLPLAAM